MQGLIRDWKAMKAEIHKNKKKGGSWAFLAFYHYLSKFPHLSDGNFEEIFALIIKNVIKPLKIMKAIK